MLWKSASLRGYHNYGGQKPSEIRLFPYTCWERARGGWFPQELDQKFAHALFPRITNRHGCVTLHRYHFSVEQGLPQTQVLLWVSGHELRAVFDTVVLAEYHCHYDLRYGKVTDIRDRSLCSQRVLPLPKARCCPLILRNAAVVYRPPVLEPSTDVALSSPTIVALYTREDGVESSVEEAGREACWRVGVICAEKHYRM